jgi:AcrR family transcriptional regulator
MGVAERRAREKEHLRSQILEAATDMIAQEGLQHLSIRKLADRIEYSPATIYLYFRDKAELVQTICVETFTPLRDKLKRQMAETRAPLPKLRQCLLAYMEHGLEHPQHYYVTFCMPEGHFGGMDPAKVDEGYEVAMETFDLLRQGLGASMDAGVIRKTDVEVAAQLTWMMMHGIVSLLVTTPNEFPWVDKKVLLNEGVDRILLGLGAKV